MTIQAQLADGRVLEFPDGTDPQVIQATVKRVLTSSASAPQEGLGAATVGGFKRAAAGLETALGSIIDPELAAQRGLARQQEIASQYAPGANLEKVKEAYAKEGLLSAAGEAISQVPAALAEQFPNIAATLAAGKAGAMAGTAVAPGIGTVVGGLTGAAIPSVLQLYGSNLIRQAEERPEDISRTAALTAAVPGAALEVAATAIPLGRTFIGKILGPEAEKLLARGTSASLERAAKEGVAATLLRGGAVGAGAEIPTEVAQQMLERLQAGLPLTTPDALAEYGEAAYGATLVGAPFGAAGRAAGRAGAREQYAALKQKEDEAAFRAEQQRALAAQEEEFKQTRERLGIPEQPLLALPAPATVAEPEKPVDLQNPIGNITREELAPEVLKYVDKYRKDMGMPRLQSFSVEDIRDAMTNINPEGEQAALDSILAFKTGFKGEETFSPEDVVNAAVSKNIAPETKGFADFLERVTGKRELETMTQPQLYAAFKSLTDLPDVAPGEQRVLPEGSNANRFTQKQYDRAIKYVNTGFAEVGGQPLAREVVSQELMEAAGLESQRAADMLLNAALRNGDLSESRQQVFRTIDPKTGEIKFTYFEREKAEAAAKKQKLDVQEQTLVSIAPKEAPKPSPRAPLPGGFEIAEQAFVEGERPSGYAITPEGRMKPLATVLEEQDVEGKIERLQGLRRKEADKMLQDVSKHEQTVARGRAALESMEARGEVDTDGYKKAKAQLARAEDILGRRIETLLNRIEEYTAPLQAKPFGKKQTTRKGFTVTKGGKTVGTFPTRAEAEQSILAQLSDKELQDIVDSGKQGPMVDRAAVELESRKKPGIRVKRTPKSEEQVKAEKERDERVQKLEELLVPMLSKFGLKDVALKIVDRIENGAGGSYFDKLIKISLEEDKPIQTLRHEAIHALKELGFFTPQQWKALEQQAKKTWIDKYLKGQMTELDGKVMTRFDAYKKLGLSEADILEEAIADAFGDFDATKPPAGMMAALFKRIKEFFAAIKRALTGAGFESAEEIFGKIEAGKLEKRAEAVDAAAEKFSLAPKGIPQDIWSQHERTRLLDQQDLDAAAPQKKAGVTRSWRTLNKMVNAHTKDEQAALKMMADMNQISSIRQAIAEGDDRALANYKVMAPELYAQETGEKFSLAKSSEANAWQADEATIKAADKFEEENGIRPYVSEGFLDLPIEAPKYSLQKFNPEKHLKFDPTLGVPINKDGTVTVYYHTTKQGSLNIGQSKVIPSEGRNRIYVTNESGGADVLRNRGNFDQDLDGSTVLVYVTPDMLQLDAEYENGRRDFFIPLAQGNFFNKKMKMQSIQKGRQEAITEEFSYEDHANRIDKAVKAYKDASAADRKKMVAAARKLLKKEHNVGSLLSENGKLEKTRIGEYGLDYQGNSVASQGLGLASAQKITDKVSTCPRSAICEGLCLGETSGGNFMFGGAAAEDVGDIQKSAFRAGARMMQYLKTEALIINPEAFATVLQAEIDSLKKWSASPTQTKINKETKKREQVEKEIYQPAVRLNVTSDFKPDMFRAIIEGNPDVMFYDYTKLGSESIAPNHHLTYSSTGFGQIVDGEKVFFKNKAGQYDHNWATMRSRLNNGQNVAMAFSSKSALPKFLVDEETGVQYRVWDGDDYDARFLDPKQPDGKGMIIGLRNKAGNLSEKNATKKTGGFFVQYDPKKDGDTVVVPNQSQFKEPGRKVIPLAKAEKLSLKTYFPTAEEAEAAAYAKAPPETKEFKLFQGASKLVEEGRAVPMFHGSPDIFTQFRENKPIFVSPDAYEAGRYGKIRAEEGKDVNIYPLWVRAETPFDYANPDHVRQVVGWIKNEIGATVIPVGRQMLKIKDLATVLKEGNWKTIEAGDVQDALKALGFDSFYVKENEQRNLAVFNANQVKSITGNIGEFGPNKDIRFSLRSPIGLYSELESKIEGISVKQAPARQWKNMINALTQKGVKPDEIQWSGVNDWLDLQQGKVSKDDLLSYLRANGVQIDEVVLGGRESWREELDILENRGRINLNERERERYDELMDRRRQEGLPADEALARYQSYTLPGGENYREVLLTLPTQFERMSKPLEAEIRALGLKQNLGDISLRDLIDAGASKDLQTRFERAMRGSAEGSYQSGHWSQPNVLAHIRVDDRTDANGNKVLFVEEIQSDWGQEGKKKGFAPQNIEAQLKESEERMSRRAQEIRKLSNLMAALTDKDLDEFNRLADERQKLQDEQAKEIDFGNRLYDARAAGIPAAPFVTKTEGWLNLALKRIMIMAAEGGYDKVAFVNGQQSADRYDLSKQVSEIMFYTDPGSDTGVLRALDRFGDRVINQRIPVDRLDNYIGKEAAKKILAQKPTSVQQTGVPSQLRTLHDTDLKVGGEGMKAFYDTIVPTALKKLLPKVGGGQMETVNLLKDSMKTYDKEVMRDDLEKLGEEKFRAKYAVEQPGFAVTPEMREKVASTGLAKFSLPRIDPRITERVDDITPVREEQGFFQRITEAISPKSYGSLRQSYLNRYERLGQYDKLLAQRMGGEALLADQSAESAALMSDLASGVAASAMGYGDRQGGIPVYRGGTTIINREVKGLIASLAPLAKYGNPKVYQYYQFWAGAKRARRLRAEDRERLFTPDDFAYADILARQFPEFEDVQKDLIAFNNGIVKFMVDTQVLSPEQGAKYTEHADYIPFYRQMEGEQTAGPNIFSAISGVRPPKKLKGGTAPLADFLETLVRNTQSSIEAGMKNAAALRAINVVQRIGDAPGVSLERLDTQETGPNIINVLERGKRVSYRTPDRLLVEAVGSLNMSELPFMGLISGPSNLLRNMVTKDPGFMLANLLRDSLSSYVTSGQNMVPIAGTMTSFARALARRSPGYEALLDAGVIGGYELSQNVEKTGDDLARDLDRKAGKKDPILLRPFTSLWQALETGTTASDAATRALVYERVLAETGNEAEALFRALEVMNFNRKGNSPLIRVLTAAVPFFNARLQGLDLFYRASTGNMNMKDAKAIQRKFFVRGATMMALSVMYYMMVADDDEYKKQEQETKDNNWLITPLGIRIPTPFEVGFIFKTMPERITAYALGNDTGQDLIDATKRGLINTFAFNPIPQTVKPVVEAITNFNFFTMRPIVGQGMGDVAPEFQVGPGTSKVAEKLGGALGVSPIKLDHVLKGYTGTIGTYVADATDLIMEQFGEGTKANKRFEQLPVVKRFVVDPEARGTITAYYQLKDAVDTFTRTSNLLEKTSKPEEFVKYVKENAGVFAVKDYVLDLEKEMKELREMRRMVLSSPMDGEQKKNLLITIGRAEQNLTSNIQTVKKIISSAQ